MASRTVAFCVLAFFSVGDAAAAPVLHDVAIATDGTLHRGAEATVYVSVSGARDLTRSEAVAGASAELVLVEQGEKGGEKSHRLASGRTDRAGTAVLRFRVPRVSPGAYTLRVTTASPHGRAVTDRSVEVADKLVLHLRTDRGMYRPGTSIRWRVTALGGVDAHPATGDEVEVVVRDPRDTAIWRGTQKFPRTGMVSGEVPLGDDLVTGSYSLVARVREIESRETVEVREVRLPAFEVRLERRPGKGRRFAGRVTARYRYGEPVRGEVAIGTDQEASRVTGQLDANGQFSFALPLRADEPTVKAVVTDGAGRTQTAELAIPAPGTSLLRVAVVPESRQVAAGRHTYLSVVTVGADGQMTPATVHVDLPGRDRKIRVESRGAVRIPVRAPFAPGSWSPSVTAVGKDGLVANGSAHVYVQKRGPALHLREAVIAAGSSVAVEGHWASARGPLLATLLRDGSPVASAVVPIGKDGAIRAELRPPAGTFGLATLRLVELGWDPKTVGVQRASHHMNVYLRPAELTVSIAAETRHRPGQRAELAVAVRDASGRPVPGAGLAA